MIWAAQHHYPYVFLEADPEVVGDDKAIYAEAANEVGYEPGPQNFGYLFRIHVQDTDEKAYEVGKGFLSGNAGVGRVPMPPEYMNPPGYTSIEGRRRSSQINLRPDRLVGGVDAAGYGLGHGTVLPVDDPGVRTGRRDTRRTLPRGMDCR